MMVAPAPTLIKVGNKAWVTFTSPVQLVSIISFVSGLALLSLLENGSNVLRYRIRASINIMRTLPFLILAYLLYCGLPELGIRMDAISAGLIARCLYHSTYFCGIFRGVRKDLDDGYIEATTSCGLSKVKIFTRVITPNILFKSLSLIAHQLLICLKDTAFLSIITVSEITAAANSLQSSYFISLNAFIVAIGLYWIVSIAVEKITQRLQNKVQQRGLHYCDRHP